MRVLHLVGSATDDFYCALSRLYAADCLRSTADPARYDVDIAYVTPDGRWRFPAGLSDREIEMAESLGETEALVLLRSRRPDVMVPQMFCRAGMTRYRALFDELGVPYVGNPAELMALAADKARTREVVAAAGVPVPDAQVLRPGDRPSVAVPAVVKPVDADNSLGVNLVRDVAEYPAAIASAREHGDKVLVESYVELGREVRCGIVELDGELVCLPLEEYRIDPVTQIRRHEDKLIHDDRGRLGFAAKDPDRSWLVDPDDPVTAPVWTYARQCHEALGCRDYSLFDFRIDPAGRPWFLEAGLYNSFAQKSVISTMAAAAGLPLRELYGSMLAVAARR